MAARPQAPAGPLSAFVLAVVLQALALPSAAEPIRVGALPFVSSAPIFIAIEEGLFRRRGLEVEVRLFQAAQPVALATATGDVDFGVTGLTAGFYNLAWRGGLRIVGGQARVAPGHRFIAYCASAGAWDSGMRDLDALAGRRVGITQIGSTFHYMLGMLADKRGFPLSSLRLIALESVPNLVAALHGSRVDAVLLPSHLALPLMEQEVCRKLGWAGEETPWHLGALFTSVKNLERDQQRVRAFLAAYREAAAIYGEVFLEAGGDEGSRARALALAHRLTRYIPVEAGEILASLPYIHPRAAISMSEIESQVNWFQARGLVDREVDPRRLVAAGMVIEDPAEPPR